MDSVAGPQPGLGSRGRWILLGAILLVGVTAAVATGLLIANGPRCRRAPLTRWSRRSPTASLWRRRSSPRCCSPPPVGTSARVDRAARSVRWSCWGPSPTLLPSWAWRAVYVLVNGHHGSAATTAVWVGEWALAVEPFVIVGLYLLFPDGHRARGRLGALSLLCGGARRPRRRSCRVLRARRGPERPFAGARDPVALASATDLAFLLRSRCSWGTWRSSCAGSPRGRRPAPLPGAVGRRDHRGSSAPCCRSIW